MNISSPLRIAIFNALDGKVAGVARVVQGRRQDADAGARTGYPLIRIGAIVIGARDTQTTNGATVTLRLHTLTRGGSDADCAAIQDAIYALLHRKPFTLTGGAMFSLTRVDTTILDGDEGQAHGVCEYRALIQTT